MQAALRPMNLGEILDRTFEIYRKKFWLFAGIAALPTAIILAIHLADIGWIRPERWLAMKRDTEGTRIVRSWFLAYGFYKFLVFWESWFNPHSCGLLLGNCSARAIRFWAHFASSSRDGGLTCGSRFSKCAHSSSCRKLWPWGC